MRAVLIVILLCGCQKDGAYPAASMSRTADRVDKASPANRTPASDLGGTQVSDPGLVHLNGLANLQWLDLHYTQVSDAAIERLKHALPHTTIHH